MNLLDANALVQFAGWIGTPEIIIIVVIILLLFGGKKIPELMRGIGKGVKEFKDGIGGDDQEKNEDASSKK
ncbi:MAG: twin-arginine translocase TatA/TatE family subunit [Bacteroidales bacterium]|nr:twin-arginine translocase TatA/TatE family subunit [Bacteroidales bacterium]